MLRVVYDGWPMNLKNILNIDSRVLMNGYTVIVLKTNSFAANRRFALLSSVNVRTRQVGSSGV